jgi:receptor protein-tyrosine kinase
VVGETPVVLLPAPGRRGRSRTPMIARPTSEQADAWRTLRMDLDGVTDPRVATLLVTSAVRGDGKTLTAANIAIAWAEAGRRTVLVDGDLSHPGVHEVFGVANAIGLSTALDGRDVPLSDLLVQTSTPGLSLVTGGPTPATGMLPADGLQRVLQQLAERTDVIVIDGPPMTAGPNGVVLATLADATLLVVRARKTSRDAFERAAAALARAHARIVAVAVRGAPSTFGSEFGDTLAGHHFVAEGDGTLEDRPSGVGESGA